MTKFLSALFILSNILSGCLDLPDGESNFIKDYKNVAGSKKAMLFLRQSGATVGDSYQVSIKDFDQPFNSGKVGNVFSVDANSSGAILDSQSISLFWLSNDTLIIDFDKRLRTFSQVHSINGVTILYRPR